MIKKIFEIGAGSLISVVLSALTSPILTRIVDPLEMGKFSMLNTYAGIITSFAFFGLNDTLSRFYFEYDEDNEKRALIKFCLIIPELLSLIIFVGFIISSKIGLINYSISRLETLFLLLIVILTIWNKISLIILQNTLNTKVYSFSIVLQKALYSLLSIGLILIIQKNSLYILSASTTISLLIPTLVAVYFTKQYWDFKNAGSLINIKEIVRYALPSFIYVGIYSIYETLETLLINNLSGEYDVGIYTSVSSLVGVFVIFQSAYSTIWLPEQTKRFKEEKDEWFISKGNRYITIIMFFVGINMIFFKDILCYILGEKYREGIKLLPFLVFNPMINTIIVTVTSGIEKSKKSIYKVLIIILSALVMIIFGPILYRIFGITGICISYAISLIFQYILTLIISNKLYPVDYGLNKFIILVITVLIFSFISSFYDFGLLSLVFYLICIFVLIVLYKKEVVEMFGYAKDFVKNLSNK